MFMGGTALLAAAAGYWLAGTDSPSPAPTSPATASAVFDLTLPDAEGKRQRMDQWRGKVLVLNYWATWCHPCKEEMPGFSRLHQTYRDKGVQFVGISIDSADKIIEFQKTTPVSYPLLIGDMTIMGKSAELGNSRQALPFTAVFDRSGNLAMSKLGRWNEADLEPKLVELLHR